MSLFRSLSRRPLHTALVVGLFALGVAAVTAVAALADALLLRPVRYPRPEALALVHRTGQGFQSGQFHPLSFRELQERLRGAAGVAAFAPGASASLGTQATVAVARVTADFFPVLGVQPQLGRLAFTSGEDAAGGEPVVVLSHAAWKTHFHGEAGVLGQVVSLDRVPRRIVGVLPPDYRPPSGRLSHPAVYVPAAWSSQEQADRGNNWEVVARSRTTRSELRLALAGAVAAGWSDGGLRAGSFVEHLGAPWRGVLTLFSSAAFLVLALACANAAHLLLARSAERRPEWAVRAALGARRLDLVRLALGEALTLAALGLGLGLLLAVPCARLLGAHLGLADRPSLGLLPAAAGGVAALAASLAAGLVPVLGGLSVRPVEVLKEGTSRPGRTRTWILVGELALATTLLAGSLQMVRTVRAMATADPGFQPKNLLVARLTLPEGAFPTPESRTAAFRALHERLSALPGVQHAALTQTSPLLNPPGHGGSFNERPVQVWHHRALGDVARTFGLPLLAGRMPEPGETGCVISAPLARAAFGEERPLGRTVALQAGPMPILGVVGGVPEEDLRQGPVPQAWWPLNPDWGFAELYLRTEASPAALQGALAAACAEVSPDLAPRKLRRVTDLLAQSGASQRQGATLLGVLAVTALVLAAIGLAGLLGQVVARRRREVGLRMALGAGTGSILGLFLRLGLRLGIYGAGAGLLGAAALSRLLRGQLAGAGALDLSGAVLPALLLLAVALLASLVPALRAARLQPASALRDG